MKERKTPEELDVMYKCTLGKGERGGCSLDPPNNRSPWFSNTGLSAGLSTQYNSPFWEAMEWKIAFARS
jgi:hypothetical protein